MFTSGRGISPPRSRLAEKAAGGNHTSFRARFPARWCRLACYRCEARRRRQYVTDTRPPNPRLASISVEGSGT